MCVCVCVCVHGGRGMVLYVTSTRHAANSCAYIDIYINTHTLILTPIYILMCVCICVCVFTEGWCCIVISGERAGNWTGLSWQITSLACFSMTSLMLYDRERDSETRERERERERERVRVNGKSLVYIYIRIFIYYCITTYIKHRPEREEGKSHF